MSKTRIQPHRERRSHAGITLIELLVAIAIMGILTVAIGYVFTGALDLERAQSRRQSQQSRLASFQQKITTLIQGAKMSEDNGDTTTYFQGISENGDANLGSDRLTFTTVAPGVPLSAQESEDDFETQSQAQTEGPIGGVAEVSLSTTAVGDPGDRVGLFQRIQRPSDTDATQGGYESLLDDQIDTIGFQFYNGTDWVTTWDTVTGDRRLPAAVQVQYHLKNDPADAMKTFIVTIPSSDVDSQTPSNNGNSPGALP